MKNLELICGTRVERHQGEDYKEAKSQRKFLQLRTDRW